MCHWFLFLGILTLYLLVSCIGYFIFGNQVDANITETITSGPLCMTAQILLIIHLFCAFIVVINPSFQDLEEYLHLPHGIVVICNVLLFWIQVMFITEPYKVWLIIPLNRISKSHGAYEKERMRLNPSHNAII